MEIVAPDCSFSVPSFGCVVEFDAGRIIMEQEDHITEVNKRVAEAMVSTLPESKTAR